MIIPIRCFTCGKVIGNRWDAYLQSLQQGNTEGDALDQLGLRRYCCRRMLLSHVDLIEKLLNYHPLEKVRAPPPGTGQELLTNEQSNVLVTENLPRQIAHSADDEQQQQQSSTVVHPPPLSPLNSEDHELSGMEEGSEEGNSKQNTEYASAAARWKSLDEQLQQQPSSLISSPSPIIEITPAPDEPEEEYEDYLRGYEAQQAEQRARHDAQVEEVQGVSYDVEVLPAVHEEEEEALEQRDHVVIVTEAQTDQRLIGPESGEEEAEQSPTEIGYHQRVPIDQREDEAEQLPMEIALDHRQPFNK
ncbi:hypothetical protein niasHS_006273 [Heterodera schachtii]|uniref:DNA-directed RNA polymerases I, II, and III subunit RPABC5 n=2 Tax=Heterodera TaxID=34509 RepID=A0ABD2JSW6_HETSC